MAEGKETKLDQIDLRKMTIEDIMKLESSALRMALADLLRRAGDQARVIASHQSHGSHADHATHSTDGSIFREPQIERIADRLAEALEVAKRKAP